MMMTLTFINNYLKIRNLKKGTTFYASDYGINGGSIRGLRNKGLIEPTGNTRTDIVPHPYDDRLLIKCEVKEWRIRANNRIIEMYDRDVKHTLIYAMSVLSYAKQFNL